MTAGRMELLWCRSARCDAMSLTLLRQRRDAHECRFNSLKRGFVVGGPNKSILF